MFILTKSLFCTLEANVKITKKIAILNTNKVIETIYVSGIKIITEIAVKSTLILLYN